MKSLKIQSFIASFFSVVFSLSIAKQLVGIVSSWVLVLLYIFTILFLLYNENRKVKELRRKAIGRNFSWYTIVFTLFISISMSSLGIYLWTNKTFEKSLVNDENKVNDITQVESEYNKRIDELRSSSISSEEYLQLKKDIEWWKRRRPADLEERAERNNQIAILQERLNDVLSQYSTQKQNQLDLLLLEKEQKLNEVKTSYSGKARKLTFDNYISFIFIILVFITEFIIINIQSEIGRYYKETDSKELKIIKDLLNQGLKEITIDDITYSQFAEDFTYKQSKKLFNLLLTLEILTDRKNKEVGKGESRKSVIYANFIEKKDALRKLRDYYFRLNNLKK